MKIDNKTKISKIIKHNSKAIDAIASINKNFKKLKNPLLRRILAPRVTISDAARIGNVPVGVLLNKLQDIGFEASFNLEPEANQLVNKPKLKALKSKNIIELDVRPILESGKDPYNNIIDKLKVLNETKDGLKIINSFEPIPLLNILMKQSYEYETERPKDGIINVYIAKSPNKQENKTQNLSSQEDFDKVESRYKNKMTEIDVRHLEMPLPMVTILENIEQLEKGKALFVHHKKLPQYLLPELEERAYKYTTKTVDENNIKLIIFKL